MVIVQYACFAFAAAALAVQFCSCALATVRCHARQRAAAPSSRPGVTLVRPLCGLETYSYETLNSSFDIAYPDYEILFCVADSTDPIVPMVQMLIADHPESGAKLLIGREAMSGNPKLNNMAKGFREARCDHIVFVDSNVFTPPDYLDQLMSSLEKGAGMVSAPPVGLAPEGFWARLECAFLNSYQARMQYAVDTLGFGFAQGKTLFFRKKDLEHGGFAELATEAAEDAAATKLIHSRGGRVRLAGPFPQLIGPRSARQMWQRQVRWARLRRASFPVFYAPEILAGAIPPLLALLLGATLTDMDVTYPAVAFLALWYAPEVLLSRAARWPHAVSIMILRDLLLPFVFVAGCSSRSFEWHGQRMTASNEQPHTPTGSQAT